MSTSLKSIRQQLLSMRAWQSDGKTLDKKIDDAINQALDRLAGDVPEALIPDEHHVVLQMKRVALLFRTRLIRGC